MDIVTGDQLAIQVILTALPAFYLDGCVPDAELFQHQSLYLSADCFNLAYITVVNYNMGAHGAQPGCNAPDMYIVHIPDLGQALDRVYNLRRYRYHGGHPQAEF